MADPISCGYFNEFVMNFFVNYIRSFYGCRGILLVCTLYFLRSWLAAVIDVENLSLANKNQRGVGVSKILLYF